MTPHLDDYFSALQERHLAELEWAEVTRALRALSSAYVQRRSKLAGGAALDGRGKRAAFALFYGPLHFETVSRILQALRDGGEEICNVRTVSDLGCGTGAGGAAWALACNRAPRVSGMDVHPWAVTEAAWTYRFFGLNAAARRADVARTPIDASSGMMAAYTMNELDDAPRSQLLTRAISSSHPLLIVEPIARAITPWWDAAAAAVVAQGGRSDDWKLPLEMPERWRLLDRAAGFRRDQLTARSLWLPAR